MCPHRCRKRRCRLLSLQPIPSHIMSYWFCTHLADVWNIRYNQTLPRVYFHYFSYYWFEEPHSSVFSWRGAARQLDYLHFSHSFYRVLKIIIHEEFTQTEKSQLQTCTGHLRELLLAVSPPKDPENNHPFLQLVQMCSPAELGPHFTVGIWAASPGQVLSWRPKKLHAFISGR